VAACESTDGSDAESEELGQYEMCMSEAEEEEQGAVSEDQGLSEEAAQGVSSGWTGGVIRHSAWEVDMLGWYNELLHGCLQQEVDLGREVVAACESSGSSGDSSDEVEVVYPGGRPPSSFGARGVKRRVGRGGAVQGRRKLGGMKWYMEGFSTVAGSSRKVTGRYTVGAVKVQQVVVGEAGKEVWLGVMLVGSRGGRIGWMRSGELLAKTRGEEAWHDRLRGGAVEGWSVVGLGWEMRASAAVQQTRSAVREKKGRKVAKGRSGEVVGWFVPVVVVDEKASQRQVEVVMRRVAVGRVSGGYEQAVGLTSRREWCRYSMSKKELAGTVVLRQQEGGGVGQVVEGQVVWEDWCGQVVEDTEWRDAVLEEWKARQVAVMGGKWARSEERDKDYDRG